jgi:hypothetical protein
MYKILRKKIAFKDLFADVVKQKGSQRLRQESKAYCFVHKTRPVTYKDYKYGIDYSAAYTDSF